MKKMIMKKLILSVLAALGIVAANAGTYYTVGGDSSGDTSFTSSTAGLDYGGWSSEASATATEAHTVASGNDYVIKDGDSLRSRSKADASWDTFKGDSLTIAGTFNLKDNDNATRTITVNNLIADGGTISVMKSNTAKLTLDGSMTVPEGKTIKFDLDGGKYNNSTISKYPYLRVASTVTGAGTVVLDLFGEVNGNFNSGLPLVRFDFAGDWSGFTGDVVKGRESSSTITSPAKSSYVLMFTGSFGGRIASLSPKGSDPYYVINHAANPKGIRAADFPNALRYRTVFYNLKSTDKNAKLFVYPKDKRPTFELTYYDTDNAETALAKRSASPSQATAIAVSDITFVDSGDGLEMAVWHYDASTYDEGGDDPGAGGDEPEELTMLSPDDGATVALLTDRQKGWIALDPEDRVKVLVSDSSAPAAYKDITSADFSNGSPVTFTWSGATGAVTLTVKKGDATVETVTTSAGSATVYNLEPGVTYTWTLTSGDVTTAAFTFTTESNPPRIIKAGTMSLLRDLCGWTGLQGCKIRANQIFRGAPPNVSSSPFESRLDAQGIDFWQNCVGLKTQIDFRNASEVTEAGANGKLTFVDNYCNYNIEYYKAYAPNEVASGTGKNFLDAVRTILTSSKRPVYFHCKWGRDRTGTMASVILGVLGVSEDDIIDDYHMSPLYNGNQPREYFNNFVSFLTSIKTTYPADTLAKSVEKYFLAIGITKTEIEQFRTDMLIGYEPPEEPPVDPEDVTLDIRPGHFLEDLTSFASAHPASSPIATGGDLVYAVGDYEYHIFTKGGTLTLSEAQTADILLVGGGGGAGWNGGGGGGGGAFVELSNQNLAIGSYTVAVGAGGAAAYADSKAWGQTGGTSSITGITGASAPGGKGGIGWNGKNGNPAATVGGQAGTAGNSAGGDGGASGGSGDNSGANGSAGSKSMILGVEQGFAGGGGGGGHVESTKAHAPSYGQDGGGNGAGSEATITDKYLATAGEDGLGGGGGGGASGTWAGKWPLDGTSQNKAILQNAGDGGDGIVIVRLSISGGDEPVEPPHEHVWGEWTTTVEPQVGVPGEKQRTCSGCDEVETEEIPALPEPAVADAMLNFGSTEKSIRPALHGCGVAPRTRALGKSNETQILKDAGFYSCRAHDLALHDGAQAIVDLQQIFPLFSKDPDDPASYRFEPTDRVLAAITNAGMKIIFRLGSCGQSHGDDTHEYYNNIFTPSSDNYDKIAAVFSKIIAHYNEGWNRGFNLGVEYWEIWNEPDADPGNRWPSNNAASEFPQLFAKVVKKVKTDHPSVKVGGPASFQLNTNFFDSCLTACNTAGACPDFYTFHFYSHYCGSAKDPGDLTAAVENMRAHLASKTCAGKSCADIEIGVTEWNYYSGPSTEWYGRLTMEGAAWCAGVAQDLQYSSADFSNWYGAGYNASFGIYNGRDGVLSKTYYSLKMVGQLVNNYTKLAARTDTDTLHVLGAVNDAGTKGCIMVTDRTATARTLTIGLSGFTGKTLSNIKCYVTDDTRDIAEVTTGFTLQPNAPEAVALAKGATRSVWLLTFDIAE